MDRWYKLLLIKGLLMVRELFAIWMEKLSRDTGDKIC